MSEGSKVFVGNLSYQCTEDDLWHAFDQCGHVEDAVIITDRETGRPRGFGFVTFSCEKDARKAIDELNGNELKGRNLNVKEAQSRRSGDGGYGGRREGGYGGGSGYRSGGDRRGYGGGNDRYGDRGDRY